MPAYLGCGGSRFLLPYVDMKSCTHAVYVMYVHMCMGVYF